jgi:hypothetical protein
MNIILCDRKDRLGSNTVVKFGDYILGNINNANIYYNSNIKYPNSIFTKPFINLSIKNKNNIVQNLSTYGGIRGHVAKPVIQLQQDLISYFRENYLDIFWNIIDTESQKRNYELPWIDSSNIICIHLRCDDCSNIKDYDGNGSANYIKKLIETNKFNKYDRNKMLSESPDNQTPIDPKKFLQWILHFKKKYPTKEIYIVYYGKIPKEINKIINQYKLKTHSSKDPDYDLWVMIHSDILLLSKSNYSLVAGYYHKGREVYSPLWGAFASHGLNSKYDKSNWKYYT